MHTFMPAVNLESPVNLISMFCMLWKEYNQRTHRHKENMDTQEKGHVGPLAIVTTLPGAIQYSPAEEFN